MSVLGENLIQIAVENECLEDIQYEGLDENHFLDKSRDCFIYLTEVVRNSDRYPTLNELRSKFGMAFDSSPVRGDIPSLVERIRKRHALRIVAPQMDLATRAFESGDFDSAFDEVREVLKAEQVVSAEKAFHSFKRNADIRIEEYIKRKAGEISGIQSEWPMLNDSVGGWMDGWFHVVVGMSGTGKSWVLSVVASHITQKLSKDDCILVVTTEMQSPRLARRVDCVRYKLPFIPMRNGKMTEEDEDRWLTAINDAPDEDWADIIFVNRKQARTVSDVLRICRQLQPKAVLIDGGYRLVNEGGHGEWKGQVGVIEALQDACDSYSVPWIVTTQGKPVNNKGEIVDWEEIDTSKMRYASEWFVNPDVVMGIQQDEDLVIIDQMEFVIMKIRDGDGPRQKFRVNWNKDEMDYFQVGEREAPETVEGFDS